MSDIKKEFEKAFDDAGIEPNDPWTPKQIALWAARWAMERCAKLVDSDSQPWAQGRIRTLSKELEA